MPHKKSNPKRANDKYVDTLLTGIGNGKTVKQVSKGENIFAQGDSADAVFFITRGRVKITVVSQAGKEARLAMLGPRDFFGEGCLVGQTLRAHSAKAEETSELYRVEKKAMLGGLHAQPQLSDLFIGLLIGRNIELEEDLCDQLFNKSEKRLARALLKLSRFGDQEPPDIAVPKVTHAALAEMVGTTRERITHFMNKFRSLGLIEYNDTIKVRPALLIDVVLSE